MSKKRNRHNGNAGGTNVQSTFYTKHTHSGRTLLWTLPSGGGVFGGARSDLAGRYGTILDCTGLSDYASGKPAVTVSGPDAARYDALKELGATPATKIMIDWPDGGTPPVRPEFWRTLIDTVKGPLAVCCVGGHGRTGTALAALYLAQYAPEQNGMTLYSVVRFIRQAHCADAIETEEQAQYLANLAYKLNVEEGELFQPSNYYRYETVKPATTPVTISGNITGTDADPHAKYKWTETDD